MKDHPTQTQLVGMETGINRAIDHASRVHECDWKEAAFDFLTGHLAGQESGYLFTCEEIRAAAKEQDFLPPPDDRTGVPSRAARSIPEWKSRVFVNGEVRLPNGEVRTKEEEEKLVLTWRRTS